MIAYLPNEPLPPDIQELIDDAVSALGSDSMLDRHPAYAQLTSWLELHDRLNEDVYCAGGWVRALDQSELAEGVRRYLEEGPDPAPRQRVALMRQVLADGLDGDERYFGLERPVHCAVPILTSAGQEAVLGCYYRGCNVKRRVSWHGLFRSEAAFRGWLHGHGLFTSLEEFDALRLRAQLLLWDHDVLPTRGRQSWIR